MVKRKQKLTLPFLPFFVIAGFVIISFVAYSSSKKPTIQAPNPTPSSVLGTSDGTAAGGAREVFVPFGYAVANNINDWTDVPGLQATVDASQYPTIKRALFEVTAFVPTGNQTIWLRLRNNDGFSYPVVTMDGGAVKFLVSDSFGLSPGPKSYYVQLKTQLGYPVQIYQARLHITTY
ncbi:hypothetical protein HY031_02255 [Candidatus Gottesmanbacteria bacterium]|nr:hypothetical protein [Candidatus Gottesmanbacteria bacterium]